MVSLKIKSLISAAMLAVVPVAASAADLPEPPIVDIDFEESGTWYLRGDVGFVYQSTDSDFTNPSTRVDIFWEDLDHTFVIGAGIGYQVNEWFRTDVTVDYRVDASFYGLAVCTTVGCSGFSQEKSSIESYTLLWNAYLEYEVLEGLRPYIGGGIGAAYVNVGNHFGVNPDGSSTPFGGDGQWNFAWALMAGVSLDVTENLLLDANYRYVNLGEVSSADDGFGGQINHEDIDAHEVRVGFRYELH
ncbi:outer membrane protein [Coralliovum pocilloporae]|uniref:outer membrane protein n=1 Tax=Coralliovum pocilloporae TaxID=3066369 RepID=UPI003306D7EE